MGKAKDHAIGIYMDGIRDGNYLEATEAHLGTRYVQHSTGVPDGKEGFVAMFSEFIARNKQREIDVLCALEEGPNVFVFAYQVLNEGAARWYTMDLFDTDAAGRVVEHWDVIGEVKDTTVAGVDVRSGLAAPSGPENTTANKQVVKEYVKIVLTVGQHERLAEFVAADLVEHTPELGNRRAGLAEGIATGVVGSCDMLFHVIGEGNMVATMSKMFRKGVEMCAFDLYRVDGGLIAEHWSLSEPLPPREELKNSGKF